MNSNKIIIYIALVIIGISIYVSYVLVGGNISLLGSSQTELRKHKSYSDDKSLYGIDSQPEMKQQFSDYVYGGIVSHHLLANLDIAKFFYEFRDQEVERVILVGPNHFYPNSYPGISTMNDYNTPYGEVIIETDFVRELRAQRLVGIDDAIIDTEHSISSLVPYIAKYLPRAKIVPIIFSRGAPESYTEELVKYLIKQDFEKTVIIASVDFSHHLYSNTSLLHDLRSMSAVNSFDYDSLWKLELDSPQSLYVLLKYLESTGAKNLNSWQQSAAQIFSDYDIEDVTSYVFAHALRGSADATAGASMLFFGDTMLGRGVAKDIEGNKDIFGGIRGPEGNFLKGYDAIAVNLEGAVASETCTVKDDELLIQSNHLSLLTQENISHVGVVNNHFNRCTPSVDEKQEFFDNNNLVALTSDEVVGVLGTDMNIGVVSIYAAPIPQDTSEIINKVTEVISTGEYDRLVVNIHWGVEYNVEPSDRQVKLAHALIDSGADLIVGHHPHVVQPVEVYKDGAIIYSLGNFISDQVGTLTQSGLSVGVFFGETEMKLFIFPFEQIGGIPTHISQEDSRVVCDASVRGLGDKLPTPHPCVLNISL